MDSTTDDQDHGDLIDMDLDPWKAIEEKFRRGREKHGPAWTGKRAILEAHDEALDLGAYLIHEYESESGREIDAKLLEELIRNAINMIHGIRVAIEMTGGKR